MTSTDRIAPFVVTVSGRHAPVLSFDGKEAASRCAREFSLRSAPDRIFSVAERILNPLVRPGVVIGSEVHESWRGGRSL